MDPAIVSAMSAVLGSLVGGSATFATAWITQNAKNRSEMIAAEIRKRETLYAAFITESSKLAMDAFDHTLDNPLKLLEVYALQNRIRLSASMPVVEAAETTTVRILQQYFGPNVALEELKKLATAQPGEREREDPLKLFSEACRAELAALQKTA